MKSVERFDQPSSAAAAPSAQRAGVEHEHGRDDRGDRERRAERQCADGDGRDDAGRRGVRNSVAMVPRALASICRSREAAAGAIADAAGRAHGAPSDR